MVRRPAAAIRRSSRPPAIRRSAPGSASPPLPSRARDPFPSTPRPLSHNVRPCSRMDTTHEPARLFASSRDPRQCHRLRLRRRSVVGERRRRRRAAPDGRVGGAVHAELLARRHATRVRRPRRAASGGLRDAGRGRPGAPPDVARARRDGARLDAGGSRALRDDARPAVLPQLPRIHARPRGRHAATAAAGAGQSPRARTGQCQGHRPQHRGPRALEALSRRHGRAPVDRRDRRRHVPADDGAFRQHHEPDVGRRPRVLTCRTPRAWAISTRASPTARTGAGTPITTTTTRGTRRPTARASSTSAARTCGASIPRRTRRAESRSKCPRIARRRRASSCPRPTTWADSPCIRQGHSLARRRARQALHVRRSGKARCASTARAESARHRHGQWLADGTTLVAVSDETGEERIHVFKDGAARDPAVGRRPRDRAARGAARRAAGDLQPSQRGAAGRRRQPAR